MSNQDIVTAELRRIAEENEGMLRPGDVVEAARPKNSPLHSRFEWDDSEAANKYRIWQARQLIAVTVEYIGTDKDGKTSRIFVSLTPDRKEDGGYRSIESVMSSKSSREQLLADALEDMERFQKKYSDLRELAEVFDAMRRIRKGRRAA